MKNGVKLLVITYPTNPNYAYFGRVGDTLLIATHKQWCSLIANL